MRYKNAMSASAMALLPKLDKHQKTWHVPEQASHPPALREYVL